MVHFSRLASHPLCIQGWMLWFYHNGFPHSEILGSKLVYSSPRLIAAGHVLRRLPAPRHPPYALSSLTTVPLRLEHLSVTCYPIFSCQRPTSFNELRRLGRPRATTLRFATRDLRKRPGKPLVPTTRCCPDRLRRVRVSGGGCRIRTGDLLRARQALSQLS